MSPKFCADYFEAATARRGYLGIRLSIMLVAGVGMAIVIDDHRASLWIAALVALNLMEIVQYSRTRRYGARPAQVALGMLCEALSTTAFASGSFLAWSYGDAQGGAGAVVFLFGGCAMALAAANGSLAAFGSTILPYLAVGLTLCARPFFTHTANAETPPLLVGYFALSIVVCVLWRKSREARAAEKEIRLRIEEGRRRAEAAEQAFARLANEDFLTRLPNRRSFDSELATRMENGGLSLFLIDLNGFKKINDTLGHSCGDQVLIEAARRLEASLSPGEFAARLGGDEFALLAPAPEVRADLTRRARQILQSLQRPIATNAGSCRVGCSVGCVASDNALELHDLLRKADLALYRSKNHKPQSAAYCFISPNDCRSVTADGETATQKGGDGSAGNRGLAPAPDSERPRLTAICGGR